jgi:hypothetical protein
MNTTFVVLAAVALLALFAYVAMRRSRDPHDFDQAVTVIRSLDIEAFRNLVDPQEEAFLRSRLPAGEFRRIKRARAQAALAYVKTVSKASLQFARFGDAARRNPDPAIAASGKQIANSAIYLQLRALEASANLRVSAAFPGFGPRPLRLLLEQYDRATHLLLNHNGLQRARSRAS